MLPSQVSGCGRNIDGPLETRQELTSSQLVRSSRSMCSKTVSIVVRFVLALLLACTAELALTYPAQSRLSETAHFAASISPSVLHPGEAGTLTVRCVIETGWHLYSIQPTPPPGPSPATVSLTGSDLSLGIVQEDHPLTKLDPNFGKNVSYHLNTAQFTAPLIVGKASPAGSIRATLTVGYQTCNDIECLPPTKISLPLVVIVTPGAIRSEYTPVLGTNATQSGKPAAWGSGLLGFLGAAFVGGLFALLTPCVFPLVPVTLGFFTKNSEGDHRKVVKLAATYAGGIIVAFTALGALAALLLGATGAN